MSTKKPAAKKDPRTDWRGLCKRQAVQLITQGKELHAVSAAVARQEDVTKEMHAQYAMQKTRGDQYETANARARFHWENRSAWFYLGCAWRALIGRQNNTNGIHI